MKLRQSRVRLRGVSVGRVTSLFEAVRAAVRDEGVPLATALKVITANPARLLKLASKGALVPGFDADLVLLEPGSLRIHTIFAKGRVLMEAGALCVRGTWEDV